MREVPDNIFDETNFYTLCDIVAEKDAHLAWIVDTHGYPPLWGREPNFAQLVYIILEQQVSLASARAAFSKLQEKTGEITPEKVLQLTDEEMKACYFSRQKMGYARHLATAVTNGTLPVDELGNMTNDEIRATLKKIKGIGDWTVDVFLMMALHRADLFPHGDVALITSIKEVKGLPRDTPKEDILQLTAQWQPYRTIAAYLLWHAYLQKRKAKSL